MIQGLLLAAGRGRRFGGDKLMTRLEDGRPMVLHAAEAMLAAVPVLAVIRPGERELEALLRRAGCRICLCADADSGMGRSLAAGVTASAEAGGWLVALADMPRIRPATHAAVAAALVHGARLAAPCYQGRRGHPVGFSREFAPALRRLQGDAGARDLLRAATDLVRLEVDDPGVILDVDTPEDLARLGQA